MPTQPTCHGPSDRSTLVSPGSQTLTAPLRKSAGASEPVGGQSATWKKFSIDWYTTASIVIVHLLALAVFGSWLFSWTGVVLLIGGVYFYGCVGMELCYHRLLTHRSFRCPLWLEHAMVVVAACCLEDSPGRWVTTHRLHHNNSDEANDPHSPLRSFFWSHMGWLMVRNTDVQSMKVFERVSRDILSDPFYMKMERRLLWVWIYLAHALLYWVIGFIVGAAFEGSLMAGVQFGFSLLVWGVLLRTVVVWHITWSVNSLSHVFGYQNYDTGEYSRNNWLVAILASGEGWHNNHHADPSSASNWHRWWEVDLIYLTIRALEIVGLATDVVQPRHVRRTGRTTKTRIS